MLFQCYFSSNSVANAPIDTVLELVPLLNSLSHNKILDQSSLKDFADDKINVTYRYVTNFVMGRVENIVGKGENAGYQHFLLFPQCFRKASLSGSLKVGIEW